MSIYEVHTVRNADINVAFQALATACGCTNCEIQILAIRARVDATGTISEYEIQGQQCNPNDSWNDVF